MPTASEQLEASLDAIAEHGARTNAFILVDTEGARAAAKAVDDERNRGVDRGPLHGMPISIKDLIDVAGQPTTAASRVRAGHIAARDALVVERLRAAGVVIIGKTNLHEFALGTTSEETAYGPVRNPHAPLRSAGGSSGGSAAAVALGMGLASIGSDTGGSVRIPAAACGVVGLKATIGEIPLDGVVPLSTTFDHVGPITRSVADAATLWAVLADRWLPPLEPPEPGTLKFGALSGYFMELLQAEVREAFESALDCLRAAGASVQTSGIEGTSSIVDTYVNISLPEAANWHATTLDTRAEDYQPPVRERLERGRTISAVDYVHAQEDRARLRREVDAALEPFNALVLPTLPVLAPPLGATALDMDNGKTLPTRAAMLRLTQLFNITGHPAISLPIPTKGLPVGLQIVARYGRTEDLLVIATACERVLGYATR